MSAEEEQQTESTAAAMSEEGEQNDWGEDISPDKDGKLFKKVLQEGSGSEYPPEGDEVVVHYTGRLLSGVVFDSSVERGEIFKFPLGRGQVIKGWDVGVAAMHKGEKCLLTCLPEFGYGKDGSPPKIPGDATLQFEIELFDWRGDDISKDGGVTKSIVTTGSGYNKPEDGSACEVHIRGTYNNRIFEDRDVQFDYGEGAEKGILRGVELAIGQMKLKETARVTIRSDYGFGEEGNPDVGIPGGADLVYDVRLSNLEQVQQVWDYNSVAERTEAAEKLKEKGTHYFKSGNYRLACKLYNRGAELVVSDGGLNKEEGESKQAAIALRVALHLNLAACHLKLSEPSLVIKECGDVLQDDDKNVKAYFRRGQAHQLLQDYDESIVDFQEVFGIEPDNKAARTQIARSRSMIKAIRDKEKKAYANMFEKLANDTESPPSAKSSGEAEAAPMES